MRNNRPTFQDTLCGHTSPLDAPADVYRPGLHVRIVLIDARAVQRLADGDVLLFVAVAPVLVVLPALDAVVVRMVIMPIAAAAVVAVIAAVHAVPAPAPFPAGRNSTTNGNPGRTITNGNTTSTAQSTFSLNSICIKT